ncbi:hypothetical protein HSX11_08390 [Oxalobacteraceae bacterium]|nr:hypothetical protein [Oxalobacteraceae bacterium]
MSKLPVSIGLKPSYVPDALVWPKLLASSAPAPLAHALTARHLLQRQTARQFHNGLLSAGLAMRLSDPVVWGEWVQLQSAIVKRLQKQQQDLGKGCAILADDYSQIRQANTMSKLMEKQFNLMSQFGALMSSQATNLMELLENVQVDYGYWASQKVGS